MALANFFEYTAARKAYFFGMKPFDEFEFETPALMHGNSSSDVIFVTPLEKKFNLYL
jgi:hypothetical protein